VKRSLILLALLACRHEDVPPDADEPSPLLDVDEAARWSIPGLQEEGYVVYEDMGVPYVYAANRADLGRLVGFTLARDRFFYMDLASRLSLGTLGELLGDAALDTDLESRFHGATWIADHVLELVDADPETKAYFDGVAEGVNAYIEAVRDGKLPPPSEYGLAYALLGKDAPVDLMAPWDRRRVAGGLVTVLFESGFETGDVGRAADAARLATTFDGAPLEAYRKLGLEQDAWGQVQPVKAIASAPGWLDEHPATARSTRKSRRVGVEAGALSRALLHADRLKARFGRDYDTGWGSNAWAVSSSMSADGRAMVATDGHLELSVPPLFYQIGIDTQHLGGGDVHQVGMMTPALPLISTGTNGKVAFGQTQLMGDITDWYSEELVLGDDGRPKASRFRGGDEDLLPFDETIALAAVPALGSTQERTLTFTRYTTFDGRWITSIEGDDVGDLADGPAPDPAAVALSGDWIKARDVDGDGRITAVSFDYAGLDLSLMPKVMHGYASAPDIDRFAEATKSLVAYSLNLVAADEGGHVFYTGFQAVPCRTYLDRNADGTWAEGADPSLLLDGTTYGGFTIPIEDGLVAPTHQDDPYRCVVPWDEYPHEKDPAQGFVVTANNDPGGLSFDGSLTNDPWYIGGPWIEGYRAAEIARDLGARKEDGVTVDEMKAVQANHRSVIGAQLVPELLASIDAARDADPDALDEAEGRVAALYASDTTAVEEVATRLQAWADRGFPAESGVQTFYEQPTAEQVEDAVATMIFNAWMGRYVHLTTDDEGIPGMGWPTGDTGRFRLLTKMLTERPCTPASLGSCNPATGESAYFDVLSTPEIETSTEDALKALVDALAFLRSDPVDAGRGGFGTDDMTQWLWGYRHWVRMNSLLGGFLGSEDYAFLTDPFNITPAVLPLADGLGPSDPRYDLPGFPRHSDELCVDAANSGTDGVEFDNAYGSVWRLVVALGGEKGFEAYNVLPGGQSGLTDSEHFADQARLWLGNQYLPVWLDVPDVAAHAGRRETFTPAD
jgi:penicillin amidase